MLNALCALSSIMFGIAELEYSDLGISENADILLYTNTVFSIILWCNILFKEILIFQDGIIKGVYSKKESLFSTSKIFFVFLEITFFIFHPNILFKDYMFTEFHEKLNTLNYVKINHIFLILSFLRVYYILRFIIVIQEYMSPSVNRICSSYFFKKNLLFALKSAMASKPIKHLIAFELVALFGYAYALKIFERHLQPSFDSLFNCVWAIGISFPTVGFGDYVAKSLAGRAIMILSVITGVFFDSMLIVAIMNLTVLDKAEKNALRILDSSKKIKVLHKRAKKVINCFRKISNSEDNLFKTISLRNKNYYELRKCLQDFNDANADYEYSESLEAKEYKKLFITLTCIMKSYESLKKEHNKIEAEFREIDDKLNLLI
jgi:hypothetical protein